MKTCGDFGGRTLDGEPCSRNVVHEGTCFQHQEGRKAEKRPRGRPTLYTDAVADEILSRLAGGETLRAICRDDHLPPAPTVVGWAIDDREGFSERYARARRVQAWSWAEEGLEIADDGRNDTYVGDRGALVTNHDVIQRSKLRVDYRKWLAGKLAAEWSDKLQVEHSGAVRHVEVKEVRITRPSTNGKPNGRPVSRIGADGGQ